GTYVLLEKSLEKWDLPLTRNHTPKYSSGYDIYKSIVQEIRYNDGGFETEDREIKLLDLEYARNEELLLLVSSVPNSNQMEFDETKNVSYFLIVLTIPELTSDNGQFDIIRCIPLKVQSAHLIMPNGGPAVFVVFPQAILLTTTIKGANYNNIVTMRDPINDRIIGFCAEGSKSWHFKDKDDNISQIHVLTTKTGVMSCQLNVAEIKEKSPQNKYDEMDIEDSQAKINRELKFTLEQAVFRKGGQNVPVECTLSPDFKGDINQVVLEISDEILESRSKFMENLNDLSFQLNERDNKMANLIKFINNSNIMDKLYYSSRQQLFWNSEKVACAKKLWEYYNMSYNSSRDALEESLRKLMTNAIQDYIQDRNIKIKPLEDISRYFFRYRVRDLGSIFTHIQRVIEILSDTEARSTTVLEANAIILLCFDAAFDFRRNNKELYAITTNDSKGSWTYQSELLKVLQRQFEETDIVIRNYTLQTQRSFVWFGRCLV
ncbi:6061_t:CDS:10, partial [Diversispora eburnea]